MPNLSEFNKTDVSTKLLLLAAEINSTDIIYVKHLLNNGADINAYNSEGNNILHMFALKGKLDLVEYLMKSKANLTLLNKDNFTAVDLALQNQHFQVARALRKYLFTDLERDLFHAINQSNLDIIKALDEQGINLNACEEMGVTPLHMAAFYGYLDIVNYLIERKVNLDALTEENISAIHYSLQNKTQHSQEVLFNLVKAGADPSLGNEGDFSALYKAAHRGYHAEVELILSKGMDVNIALPEYNLTALHGAVKNRDTEMVHLLLSKGADITIRDYLGNLPIDYAKEKQVKYLKTILDSSIVQFISAAANGRVDLMDALLQDGADIDSLVKSKKYNFDALGLAASKCQVEAVKYLMEHGVKYKVDFFGEGPLYIAARKKCYKALDIMIDHGVDYKSGNWLNITVLDVAKGYQYGGEIIHSVEDVIV
jgi:ankyrin repeat protein